MCRHIFALCEREHAELHTTTNGREHTHTHMHTQSEVQWERACVCVSRQAMSAREPIRQQVVRGETCSICVCACMYASLSLCRSVCAYLCSEFAVLACASHSPCGRAAASPTCVCVFFKALTQTSTWRELLVCVCVWNTIFGAQQTKQRLHLASPLPPRHLLRCTVGSQTHYVTGTAHSAFTALQHTVQ